MLPDRADATRADPAISPALRSANGVPEMVVRSNGQTGLLKGNHTPVHGESKQLSPDSRIRARRIHQVVPGIRRVILHARRGWGEPECESRTVIQGWYGVNHAGSVRSSPVFFSLTGLELFLTVLIGLTTRGPPRFHAIAPNPAVFDQSSFIVLLLSLLQ